jgi:hypothetical protein
VTNGRQLFIDGDARTIDKMAIHPLGAALSFKADDPVEAALQGAFLAAISLKFDHQLSSKPKPRH